MNINRTYKDRLFRFLFNDRKHLLDLYNAVNGSNYTKEEDLEINTLEDIIYMKMKNDLSFIINSTLNIYEHQGSYNPNMPLRGLFYLSDLLRKITQDENIYGSKIVKIPTPCYIVFYNGKKESDDREILKLSDAFGVKSAFACVEFRSIMLNINLGHNKQLMEKCNLLKAYAQYVHKVRTYSQTMEAGIAIEQAINDCINENNAISSILKNHRAEVINMTLTEYDEAKVMEKLREEALEEGMEKGMERIIKTMNNNHVSIEHISKMTSLTIEKVREFLTKD